MSKHIVEKNDELWLRLQYKVFEKKIAECFNLFSENGIEPILIKGWAVSRFYPNEWERIFSDVDLCVEPSLYLNADSIRQSEKGNYLNIDLHKGFRHLDTVSWEELFSRSEIFEIEGVKIRVLCEEDHLRVQCVHWLNDGGGYKDKLWDIYYLVKNRSKSFDWDMCLNSVNDRRRAWVICAIGLAHKYLDLDIDDTPISKEAKDLPEWLTKAVEKEWKSDIRLKDLMVARHNWTDLFQQIKKRIPPNPIQATIEMEGNFDQSPRIYYQIGNILYRSKNSLRQYLKYKFRPNS